MYGSSCTINFSHASKPEEGGRAHTCFVSCLVEVTIAKSKIGSCFDFPEHIKTKQAAETGVMSLRDKSSGDGAEHEEQFGFTVIFITFWRI